MYKPVLQRMTDLSWLKLLVSEPHRIFALKRWCLVDDLALLHTAPCTPSGPPLQQPLLPGREVAIVEGDYCMLCTLYKTLEFSYTLVIQIKAVSDGFSQFVSLARDLYLEAKSILNSSGSKSSKTK